MSNRENWNNENTVDLIRALLSLRTAVQARKFLRDLLTEAELIEFGNRWRAARMLATGKPYMDIIAATGLSSRTIARINWWLSSGVGGYRATLSRVASNHLHTHPS